MESALALGQDKRRPRRSRRRNRLTQDFPYLRQIPFDPIGVDFIPRQHVPKHGGFGFSRDSRHLIQSHLSWNSSVRFAILSCNLYFGPSSPALFNAPVLGFVKL